MERISQKQTDDFFSRQLDSWPDVATRFKELGQALTKRISIDGLDVTVQYNPARIRSSAAKTDKKSIASRPCFLCDGNRPAQQASLPCHVAGYKILVNPFPICRFHLTIPSCHCDQLIKSRIADMAEFADSLDCSVIFYNGPRCGASAPDYFHFQAVRRDELPIVKCIEEDRELPFGVIVISGRERIISDFGIIMNLLPEEDTEDEPKINLLCYKSTSGELKLVIIPRRAHRPTFYGDGEGQMLVSPASIDLAGIMVAARREDFDSFSSESLRRLYAELCYTQQEVDAMIHAPEIAVGIMEEESIRISAEAANGALTVHNVTIGKNFHWQRKEDQQFLGSVETVITPDNKIALINHIDVETYLKSVISSEMSAQASLELLKAHAVISSSWVLKQKENRLRSSKGKAVDKSQCGCGKAPDRCDKTDYDCEEFIKWYDHEDHTLYDVCADDHCQRYQGMTRQTTATVDRAVDATRGEVLTFNGELCDARFSKCCGGAMEIFANCWADEDHPYLAARADNRDQVDAEPSEILLPDLTDEASAGKWIEGRPDAFCNTNDNGILAQVLNNYDMETSDFYRWHVEYDGKELGELIFRKSGNDLGIITSMTPLERGKSGRIVRLLIEGSKRKMVVGKELEIRRWLSPTHLYSSAFTIEKIDDMPHSRFILHGAGWGHGVGLCQIGAAVMGAKGYTYRQILAHYYPGAEITRRYL